MKGEEIPEGQPLPVYAIGSGQAYEISEWRGESWEGIFGFRSAGHKVFSREDRLPIARKA